MLSAHIAGRRLTAVRPDPPAAPRSTHPHLFQESLFFTANYISYSFRAKQATRKGTQAHIQRC